MIKHRWWHWFFLDFIPTDSQRFANMQGWRLRAGQGFAHFSKCNWTYVVEWKTHK